MTTWKFYGATTDGDTFFIHGINIWSHSWNPTGETADCRDPLWNGQFNFPIYTITTPEKTITFATGEFSNTIWGIFLPETQIPHGHQPIVNIPRR